MQLTPVCLTGISGTLVHVVEELQRDLVCDESSQEMHIPTARQDPEQRGAIQVRALASQRIERVSTDLRIRDRRGSPSPHMDLAGDRRQSPQQLTARGDQ